MEKGFDYSKNNLIVLSSQGEALKVYSALNLLYPDQDFIHLPNSEVLPYDFFSSPPNIRSERIKALSNITKQTNKTLVSSIQTLMSPCSNYLHVSNINNLKVGDQFQRQSVISDLEDNGYKRTEVVTESGDFSQRGSLIDIFLSSCSRPVRIEIFEERIESIRYFDPRTQITTERTEEINSLPAYEYPKDDIGAAKFKENWRLNFDTFEKDSDIFNRVMKRRKAEGVEMYLPLFFDSKPSVIKFVENFQFVYFDQNTAQAAVAFQSLIDNRFEEYRYDLERPLLHPKKLFTEFIEITELFQDNQINYFNVGLSDDNLQDSHEAISLQNDVVKPMHILPKEEFLPYFDKILDFIRENVVEDDRTKFSELEYERFRRVRDYFESTQYDDEKIKEGRIDFYNWFTEYDKRRNVKFLDTFPEMEDFWNLCKATHEEN